MDDDTRTVLALLYNVLGIGVGLVSAFYIPTVLSVREQPVGAMMFAVVDGYCIGHCVARIMDYVNGRT